MKFVRSMQIPQAGLLKVMRAAPSRLLQLFGLPESNGRNAACSEYVDYYHVCCSDNPEELYSIYTSFGVFRLGGYRNNCEHVGKLLELINPCRYMGWGMLRAECIVESFDEGLLDLNASCVDWAERLQEWRKARLVEQQAFREPWDDQPF